MSDDADLKHIIDRITRLENAIFGMPGKITDDKPSEKKPIEFSMNERAYAQKFCRPKSGPAKFTLLVAFLVRGEESKEIPYTEVKKLWERMTVIIGKFNPAYSDAAKRLGSVTTPKKGFYQLAGTWREVIE